MSAQELVELRKCEAEGCDYKVPNGITDVTQIIGILNNHILGAPIVQKSAAGGSVISNATLPVLEEGISETQYQAWLCRFERYCTSCKLWDDKIKDCVFEAVPTDLADQICMDVTGDESIDEILAEVKSAVVKKRSGLLP